MSHDTCPNGHDLRGAPIPVESLEKGYYGKWDGKEERFFSNCIGVEIRGVYDGVLFWRCPVCGVDWHRWNTGDMRVLAEKYMNKDPLPELGDDEDCLEGIDGT